MLRADLFNGKSGAAVLEGRTFMKATMSSTPLLLRRACQLVLFLCLATATIFAADEKQAFNIPAGSAAQTLKQFAVQAKREIVFAKLDEVQTHAVQGDYTPREAISLMLADTGLTATQDQKTGAFAVRPETVTEKNG